MSTQPSVNSDVYSTGKAEKITIEKSIDEIRKGNGYYVSNTILTGAGLLVNTIMIPQYTNKSYHITFKIAAVGNGSELWIFEGTGSANTGAHTAQTKILTPYNLNRKLPTGSLYFAQFIVTGASGTGSQIYKGFCPDYVVLKFGSSEARQNEMILDSTKTYILSVSGSGLRIGFEAYWYEQ